MATIKFNDEASFEVFHDTNIDRAFDVAKSFMEALELHDVCCEDDSRDRRYRISVTVTKIYGS